MRGYRGSTRFRRWMIGAVVLPLALAGCGGSDGQVAVDAGTSVTDGTGTEPNDATDPGEAPREGVPIGGTSPAAPSVRDKTLAVAPPGGVIAPGEKATTKGKKATTDGKKATTDGKNGSVGPGARESAPQKAAGGVVSAAGGLEKAVGNVVATQAIFGGKAACRPATLSEVNIGNVSTLSGVLGELFSPARSALDTFVASQNACGGLNGHRIKLFASDDQGDPSTAAAKIQELIQKNKVLAFVGNIQVLTVDAIVPVIKKFGIPVIGSDMTSNTWVSNPLLFPQASNVQAGAFGYVVGARDYFKVKRVGIVYCVEVPRACEQGKRALEELAPQFGIDVVKSLQVSITAPSYVQQCLEFKSAGVEALAMSLDAASMNRFARSCTQAGFHPKVMPYPLGVGNEKQFFGNAWLGNAHVGMNSFPWMGNTTPAERYWQASIKKFNPGFDTGGAASLAWASGALLVAASAGLSAENPTTQQLLDALYTFNGQKFTELGGLAGPRTFQSGGLPKVPYCLWSAVSNAENTGWAKVVSKPTCDDVIAPSDPQSKK